MTDANSRQAEIWIVSLLSLMYSVIILAGRVVVKWNFHGLDDVVIGVAYVRTRVARDNYVWETN